jgi:hypothetical protein
MIGRKGLTFVAALGAVWLASPSLAFADEDDARDACRELAQRSDWRDIETNARREGDDRWVIRVRGERDGRDRERTCIYDDRRNEAEFRDNDEREVVEDARDACRRIAQEREWRDVDTDLRREGDDRIVIMVQGERNRDDRERRCVYNIRRDEARFEDQPRNRDEVEEARDACRRIAQGREWDEVDTDVRREGDDRIVIRVRGERNNNDRDRRCIYNTRTNDARFEDQPRNR